MQVTDGKSASKTINQKNSDPATWRDLRIEEMAKKENKLPSKTKAEVCNAINVAVACGKTVTVDYPGVAHTTQIAGAFPNALGVCCIQHLDWPALRSYTVPVIWLFKGAIVRAYRPQETTVEILYVHPSDDD